MQSALNDFDVNESLNFVLREWSTSASAKDIKLFMSMGIPLEATRSIPRQAKTKA